MNFWEAFVSFLRLPIAPPIFILTIIAIVITIEMRKS